MLQSRWLGPDHQTTETCVRLFSRIAHARQLAAAQHGASAAQRPNFVQLVRDVQNAHALADQLVQHHKEFLHSLRCQHRSRLVQNQELGFGQQSADDLHPLHLAHAQRVHRALGLQVQAVLAGLGHDALGHFGQAQRLVQTQPHVFGHGERVKQAEVLKHHADAQLAGFLRVADVDRLAVEHHLAFIGLDRAVDDFHKCGFARAVFAQYGMGLAGHHGQRHVLIGHHARVALGDAL